MLPTYPANPLPRPFANNGTFQVIPDAKAAEGRASWQEGFPTETQLPLSQGGIAPSRPDFNGILYMLSALAFWQQSGGQWVYSATLDYNTPAVVFHNGMLWWCKAPNGPGTTTPGAVEPGTNTDYWIDFLSFLAGAQGGGGSIGNPVGTVIMYYGVTAPDGYLACDGQPFSAVDYPKLFALLGVAVAPDMRGLFVRGLDPTAVVDPDGATRAIGSKQTDAGRNITGHCDWVTNSSGMNGPFINHPLPSGGCVGATSMHGSDAMSFDASRVWGAEHTAPEFRGANINLLYCIRHD